MRKNLRSIKAMSLVLNGKIVSEILSDENIKTLKKRILTEDLKDYSINIVSTLNNTIVNTIIKEDLKNA